MTPAEILTKARDRLIPAKLDLRITPDLPCEPGRMGLVLNMPVSAHADYLAALFALRQAAGLAPDDTLYSYDLRWPGGTLANAVGIYNTAILRLEQP